jgi:hypothetical protein
MISKKEFSEVARAFMDELSILCLRSNPDTLADLPGFGDELAEVKALVSRPDASATAVLSSSFGLVDEFATQSWEEVVSQAYESYAAAVPDGP